jgi:hypothetical protein
VAIPRKANFESKGTLETEKIEMTIDSEGFGFLMSILTNLYVDPVLAVIREYSTNAIDAQIENGYEGAVNVTLPSAFSPELVIRDRGVGMSYEDIRDTYSKYVASTKRGSDTQAGMFGIGSKSALAYGDKFSVESVKDGEKIVCLISRTGRGASNIQVVSRTKTSDESGTTIKIPVRNPRDFREAADKFYPYVKKGRFLVDGVDLGQTFEGHKLDDNLWVRDYKGGYRNVDKSVVVMGNVPYFIDTTDTNRNKAIIKYVPQGTFEPTPPREGLERTDDFDEKINSYFESARLLVVNAFSDEIKDMSPSEASAAIGKSRHHIQMWGEMSDVIYKGMRLDSILPSEGATAVYEKGKTSYDFRYTLYDELMSSHVLGYTGRDVVSIASARRARALFSSGNSAPKIFLWKDKTPKYFSGIKVGHWADASSGPVNPFSYTHAAGADWKRVTSMAYNGASFDHKRYTEVIPYKDYDSSKQTLVYFSSSEVWSRGDKALIQVLIEDEGVFLVLKTKGQIDKLLRLNPEAVHFKTLGQKIASDSIKGYGELPFLSAAYRHDSYLVLVGVKFDALRSFKSIDSPSPHVVTVVKEFGELTKAQAQYRAVVDDIDNTYPLLGGVSSSNSKHYQQYVNAIDQYKENV